MELRSMDDELRYNLSWFLTDINDIGTINVGVADDLIKAMEYLESNQCIINGEESFAMCFTKEEDDLFHWTKYGNNCKGVAIGFDKNIVEKMPQIMGCDNHIASFISLNEMLYGREAVKDHIRNELQVFYESDDSNNDALCVLELYSLFTTIRYLYKEVEYKNDKELRMLYLDNSLRSLIKVLDDLIRKRLIDRSVKDKLDYYLLKTDLKRRQFSSSKKPTAIYGSIMYHSLNLDEIWKDAVTSITLGPKNDLTVDKLRLLLDECGLEKTVVRRSNVRV